MTDGFLRQPQPGLRRQRRVPLLRLEPQLHRAHGLLRGQPRHRDAPAGHGRPAPRRRGAALRRATVGARDDKKAAPAPFRIDPEGLDQADLSRCPSRPGNYFFLKAGKGKVLWASVDAFTESEYEEIFKPSRARQVDAPHLRHGRPQGSRRSTDKVRDFALRTNGEQLLVRREADLYTTSVDKAFGSKAAGDKLNLSGLVYTRRPPEGVAPDLQRRLALVPRFLLRRQLARPRLEGHGRQVPRLHPRPVIAGRAELGPVPDGRRALRLAHLRRRRRLRPGRDARLARLHRPARRRPRPRQGRRALQARPDLRPDRHQPQPRRRRSSGPTSPSRKATSSSPSTARRSRPATTTSSSSRRRRARRSRSRSTPRPSTDGRQDLRGRAAPQRHAAALLPLDRATTSTPIDKATGGRVGYMHINAMGSGGIGEFDKFWRAFRYKEGIIIDVRAQLRRLDGVFPHRQARAGADGLQRPARHGPVPLPRLGRQRQLRRHLQREQRLGRRGLRRALQGAQARARSSASRRGAAWSASSTSS